MDHTSARPNVILILADDMGFSDLGHMGSEIRTPHIDAMARHGAVLTAMYNCARCCPTRASLLTGLYPHKAGIGHMGADLGSAAYQGYLREDAATIAERLRGNGYRTLMAGKWHVGGDLWAKRVHTWRSGEPELDSSTRYCATCRRMFSAPACCTARAGSTSRALPQRRLSVVGAGEGQAIGQ